GYLGRRQWRRRHLAGLFAGLALAFGVVVDDDGDGDGDVDERGRAPLAWPIWATFSFQPSSDGPQTQRTTHSASRRRAPRGRAPGRSPVRRLCGHADRSRQHDPGWRDPGLASAGAGHCHRQRRGGGQDLRRG
ncbi:unnamed protein product, partial [Prorocentrum cordatum]